MFDFRSSGESKLRNQTLSEAVNDICMTSDGLKACHTVGVFLAFALSLNIGSSISCDMVLICDLIGSDVVEHILDSCFYLGSDLEYSFRYFLMDKQGNSFIISLQLTPGKWQYSIYKTQLQ